MKIALKRNGTNCFNAYQLAETGEDLTLLGEFKGSIATVRRLIQKTMPTVQFIIVRTRKQGWY